ncbi:Hsp20/alpha crystallin family protein [Thiolapillus brandeum]|uniref:Heat shock protein HSP20 n=1 Tax=Thiolapillus brandeum TaxID=1076588 RepID=A0A7U6GIF6_9GAMM|nr:Hsp20/alpha crystallin family protein [Thiolapillus brandeum]BAO44192.1 heat shock protein HSP20 [Thiolapillus brandeum]
MSTLQQIKSGISQAWDTLLDGWQQLYRRAANAITRFRHGEAADEQELALRSSGWGVLAAEVYDDDDKVVVRVEAPGMEGKDFDIEVLENYLVIRGQKNIQKEHSKGRYHVLECAYGSFERALPLPEEVIADEARASYKRGVLRIELPKSSSARRRRIDVEVH